MKCFLLLTNHFRAGTDDSQKRKIFNQADRFLIVHKKGETVFAMITTFALQTFYL